MTVGAGFDEFVAARSPRLLRTAYLLTHDWALAEDLLQTALARAWEAWRRIDGNPEPYVRRILVNAYASWWRRRWMRELWRVDPATGRVVETIPAGEICCDLTWDGSAVWAVDPAGAVFRIGGPRHRVVLDRNAHTNAVYGGGVLWVASDTTSVLALDPKTGEAIRRLDVDGVPFLAADGLVWGAAPTLLWAVDARTGAVARRIPLTDSIEVLSLEVTDDAIWVGIRRPGRIGAVLRLDPASGAVRDELREIRIPARIEYGFGSVWITDSGSSSLYRVATGS
jgi:outer membrane protein assembly factor BamB